MPKHLKGFTKIKPFYIYGPVTREDSVRYASYKRFCKLRLATSDTLDTIAMIFPLDTIERRERDSLHKIFENTNIYTAFYNKKYPPRDSIYLYMEYISDTVQYYVDGKLLFSGLMKHLGCFGLGCTEYEDNKILFINRKRKKKVELLVKRYYRNKEYIKASIPTQYRKVHISHSSDIGFTN